MSNEEKPARAPANVRRKLAAILAADVKGYSRLMGEDEVATLHTLTAYRQVTDALIQQHQGRVVGSAGDSVLAEFASVVDAVQCAVEIQRALKARNAELPEHRRMEFRIGINLGDVMVEGEQIYGDGVNIAARLESLADAGGICISGVVYDQVKNKLSLRYEDLGEQRVKNIAEPVRVWRIRMEEAGSPASAVPSPQPRRVGIAHRHRAVVVVGLLLISGTLLTVWHLFGPTLSTRDSVVSPEAAPAALPLPDKPSIAVLPFVNMSEDPKQEYFSDGIAEDLITDLSKLSGLFVISRNSTFTYKGKAVKLADVSKELGVQYVLEGSVRRTENQVRVTAQLVDATTDHHLWAERYDRSLQDIFALQDEIRQKIMFALKVKLVPEEQAYFQLSRAKNLDAYELLWRAREVGLRFTKEGMAQARQLCEQALALDPQYAGAYASLSSWYMAEWQLAASEDPQTLERAFEAAQQAIVLDDTLPFAHAALGDAYKMKGQLELAITEGQKSVTLGPNCSTCYGELAEHLMCARRPPEEILPLVEKALRLNPRDYRLDYHIDLAMLYRQMGRHDEAITKLKQILLHNSTFGSTHRELVLNYVDLGREEEAKREMAEFLKLIRPFTLEQAIASNRKRWAVCIERDPAAYVRNTATFRRLAAEVEKNK